MGAPHQYPYPHRYAQPLGALRLRLAPGFGGAEVDGAWWPYGRDLTREVPHLVDDFPKGRGRVDRVVYAPDDWDVVATEVFTGHGRVKVGFLPADRPGGLVLLRLTGSGIVRLRVLWTPPDPSIRF
ncbi:hypothetical protein D0Z08_23660 [Nocardioides immobilis]|uniref:Uncharacterized protein n=1 Tax=Nocardioides immobilis TaxID=2049295 RepID=A0A417XW77_9ACTN|nr:DUF5994 family protein [Nocardioides immobilis]RHW24520.1 hypothetical protein D0Z08_23660 [Nocardioides immobilis]